MKLHEWRSRSSPHRRFHGWLLTSAFAPAMASQINDFYSVLGVSETASSEELKAAYREAAKRTHPDLNRDTGSEDAFKRVSAAYEVLRDPHSRSLYDRQRKGNSFSATGEDPLGEAAAAWAWQRWQTAAESAERRAKREEERRRAEAEAIAYWVAQKEFAQADQLRFRREAATMQAAADARRARVLSTVWATRGGLIWQDAVACVALCGALVYTASRVWSARRMRTPDDAG